MAQDPLPVVPPLDMPFTEVWQMLGLAFPPHCLFSSLV